MVSFWDIWNQRIPTVNPCNRKVALLLRLLLVVVWVSSWLEERGVTALRPPLSATYVGAVVLVRSTSMAPGKETDPMIVGH